MSTTRQETIEKARTYLSIFGYEDFREDQAEIVADVMERKDVLVIAKAGGGKSLSYQIPAFADYDDFRATTVVVSPTRSLIKDQQDKINQLSERNGQAISFSDLDLNKQNDLASNIVIEKGPAVLFITPESFKVNKNCKKVLNLLRDEGKLARIVFDEAHLVKFWGLTFRPAYDELKQLTFDNPGTPIVVLSATIRKEDVDDVVIALGRAGKSLRDFRIYRKDISRPELRYEMHNRPSRLINVIAARLKGEFLGQSGIVYCMTKNFCEMLALQLRGLGLQAEAYHSESDSRPNRQDRWNDGLTQALVATTAFGMGIDKHDVRFIIFTHPPVDMESFYQQAGRAGRDGLSARVIVYWKDEDFAKLEHLIKFEEKKWTAPLAVHKDDLTLDEEIQVLKALDTQERRLAYQNLQVPKLSLVRLFILDKSTCRHNLVRSYFDQSMISSIEKSDNCCDNCHSSRKIDSGTRDMSRFGEHFLWVTEQLSPYSPTRNQIWPHIMGWINSTAMGKDLKSKHREEFELKGFWPETWNNIRDALEIRGLLKTVNTRQMQMMSDKGRNWRNREINKVTLKVVEGHKGRPLVQSGPNTLSMPIKDIAIYPRNGRQLSQELKLPGLWKYSKIPEFEQNIIEKLLNDIEGKKSKGEYQLCLDDWDEEADNWESPEEQLRELLDKYNRTAQQSSSRKGKSKEISGSQESSESSRINTNKSSSIASSSYSRPTTYEAKSYSTSMGSGAAQPSSSRNTLSSPPSTFHRNAPDFIRASQVQSSSPSTRNPSWSSPTFTLTPPSTQVRATVPSSTETRLTVPSSRQRRSASPRSNNLPLPRTYDDNEFDDEFDDEIEEWMRSQ